MRTSPRPTIAAPHARAPRWIVAGLALLSALALLEVLTRLEGAPVCAGAREVLLEPDPEVGWTYVKGATLALEACDDGGAGAARSGGAAGAARSGGAAGADGVQAWRAPTTVNSAGLADQEWPEEKRPGEVRVLVLGNQTADGIGVARSDRLSVRLMHLADRVRGARVSAINATIEGYATAEEQRWLERVGLRYHPDIVVLLLDPVRDLRAAVDPVQGLAPAQALPPASGLLDLSATARWVAGHPSTRAHGPVWFSEPAPLRTDAERERARAQLVANVASLAEVARRAGAGFAVVVAPPCPPPAASGEDLCKALEGTAACTDLEPTFAEVRADAARPVEMCLPGLARWGRDAHFLASLRAWDLLQSSGLWPPSVVRGYRL